MPQILVSWSTAYDNIMQSDTIIKNHIPNQDLEHMNISYLVSNLEKQEWGTWLNIVYNLSLLGEKSILLSSVGKDFVFSDFLKENVNLEYINYSDKYLTARSYITNDAHNNQITAFYPWAMQDSCQISNIKDEDVEYSIVSANHISVMKKHIKLFKEKWYKTFFDPGQQITQMTKEDLDYCFFYSDYIILNEYEYILIKQIAEKTDEEMIALFEKMILTYWIRWSKIFDRNYNIIEIPGVENSNYINATWAWDAYRAGLLKWLNSWYSWEISAKIWAVLASLSTEFFGWQNHFIDWKQFKELYKETFWEEL